MPIHRKSISVALVLAAACSTTAFAGGFQRGTADTDILFEPGTMNTRVSLTYVDPQRGLTSINGQDGDFGDYTGDYLIPNYSVSFGNEVFGCAGTATESFAANADYSGAPGGALPSQVSSTQSTSTADRLDFATATSISQTQRLAFESQELGLTCRVSYQADSGRYSLLGGVFVEDFHFEGTSFGTITRGPQAGLRTRVEVESDGGYKAGFRIGAAYEIPEYALRIQAMYRSEVKHDDITGDGTVTFLNAPITPITVESALSEATSPQFVDIKAQTGIAPGWLLLGSFRWTDWSTNEVSVSSISNPNFGISSSSYAPYHWRDGYTAQIGVGHAFNDQISAAVAVGYDSGVSTGAETTYTDLYTLSGGVSFKANKMAELRFGGLVGYWTSGDQSTSQDSYYNATVGDDMVYGINASLRLTF
ncbi:long-chain fatty acid transporter [Jiella sp. 40Bstr34]|uniref:Long-chain fatty acid transporter n=2 Tax=Jiella pacifica TaxID=2696469 RepID=A0A6N9TCF0_9HYPH|nr:long-chain fatty acid transporter [Jiella pacifica]